MESHNRLRTLQQQLAQKGHWEAQLQALKDQQALLKRNVQALEKAKQSEQADVDRLEGRTLAAFFYNAIGKMEEKLTQERREAYAARAKYDATCRELADVEQDILRVQGELDHLVTCRQEYDQAFQAKARALKASGSPAGLQVLQAEETLAQHASQIKELQEAISAGELAQGTIQELLSSLDSAESWGQWDGSAAASWPTWPSTTTWMTPRPRWNACKASSELFSGSWPTWRSRWISNSPWTASSASPMSFSTIFSPTGRFWIRSPMPGPKPSRPKARSIPS